MKINTLVSMFLLLVSFGQEWEKQNKEKGSSDYKTSTA
jgi:hypothetical protein